MAAVFGAWIWLVHLPRAEYEHRRETLAKLTGLRDEVERTGSRASLQRIIDSLTAHNRHERSTAAAVLRQLGPAAEPAVPALIDAAKGEDLHLKREATLALGAIGPPAQPAVPVLIELTRQHPNADIGWFAAEALGNVADPDDEFVYARLSELWQSPYQHLSESAKRGLQALERRREGISGARESR